MDVNRKVHDTARSLPVSQPTKGNTSYQRCTRCVMDSTDPNISFDEHGVCSHCRWYDQAAPFNWMPNDEGYIRLQQWVQQIRIDGRGKDYDCILGMSGGADSAYLAWQAKELGLRPLVVHVDTGWNSELAVHNIARVMRKLGFDLHTEVIDWEEMRDLQVAYLKSGVLSQDTPQDHAIFSTLYKLALKTGVGYLLSGINWSTECINVMGWGYDVLDARQIRSIHARHGSRPLATFPLMEFDEFCSYRLGYPERAAFTAVPVLNLLPYNKTEAIAFLAQKFGFRDYQAKHYESVFTKFFQGYYLPKRCGIDKRIIHFSSMILTGQMTRDQALAKLQQPAYDEDTIGEELDYVRKKLQMTEEEFQAALAAPVASPFDYDNNAQNFARAGEIARRMRELEAVWNQVCTEAGA